MRLDLTDCRCDPRGPDVGRVAIGDAITSRMHMVDSLEDALADTASSIGFTRRAGATRYTHASITALAAEYPWAIPGLLPEASSQLLPAAAVRLQPPMPSATSGLAAGASLQQHPVALQPGIAGGAHGSNDASNSFQENSRESMQGRSHSDRHAATGGALLAREAAAGHLQRGITALVFGREESGLTEAELRLCSHACGIQTGRIQGSMNLSHAVAVVLSECYSRRLALADGSMGALYPVAAVSGSSSPAAKVHALQKSGQVLEAVHVQAMPPSSQSLPSQEGIAVAASAMQHDSLTRMLVGDERMQGHRQGEHDMGLVTHGSSIGSSARASQQVQADSALMSAPAKEIESLLLRLAAIAEASGLSSAESSGGGAKGNHGRKRLPVGHARALVARARMNAAEVRSLHGLAAAVLERLAPEHELAPKRSEKALRYRHKGAAVNEEAEAPDAGIGM